MPCLTRHPAPQLSPRALEHPRATPIRLTAPSAAANTGRQAVQTSATPIPNFAVVAAPLPPPPSDSHHGPSRHSHSPNPDTPDVSTGQGGVKRAGSLRRSALRSASSRGQVTAGELQEPLLASGRRRGGSSAEDSGEGSGGESKRGFGRGHAKSEGRLAPRRQSSRRSSRAVMEPATADSSVAGPAGLGHLELDGSMGGGGGPRLQSAFERPGAGDAAAAALQASAREAPAGGVAPCACCSAARPPALLWCDVILHSFISFMPPASKPCCGGPCAAPWGGLAIAQRGADLRCGKRPFLKPRALALKGACPDLPCKPFLPQARAPSLRESAGSRDAIGAWAMPLVRQPSASATSAPAPTSALLSPGAIAASLALQPSAPRDASAAAGATGAKWTPMDPPSVGATGAVRHSGEWRHGPGGESAPATAPGEDSSVTGAPSGTAAGEGGSGGGPSSTLSALRKAASRLIERQRSKLLEEQFAAIAVGSHTEWHSGIM